MTIQAITKSSMTLSDKVYKFLTTIPKNKVVTYKQIAIALGNKNLARAIGNILHVNPNPVKYPCYKVVNSQGYLAKHFGYKGINNQRRLLINDGIEVINYKVDLNKYMWKKY